MASSNSSTVPPDRVSAVRAFNRFHTRLTGVLNEDLLASSLSLTKARILFEIAGAQRRGGLSAAELARILLIDTGYLSRLLKALVKDGLIARVATPANAKRLALTLTEAGRKAFARLDRASAKEVTAILSPLPEPEQRQLVGAMARIRRLLSKDEQAPTVLLRDPEPGDLGAIIQRQALLYANEYGFNQEFEALLARIVAEFGTHYDPKSERCWVAESEGEIVGSAFIVREDAETAKLRMLYVDASMRGLGLGRRMVETSITFARAKGYNRIVLWTNEGLDAARHIYEALGFELTATEPHHSFGKDLVGQTFELAL